MSKTEIQPELIRAIRYVEEVLERAPIYDTYDEWKDARRQEPEELRDALEQVAKILLEIPGLAKARL